MSTISSIKSRLLEGEKITGCWTSLFSPVAAEIMANAGYDLAMIDLEHGPGSYLEAVSMIHAIESRSCQPIIRAPSSNQVDIKRVLDIGPNGIMVPNIRNITEALEVVKHCRYAPAGDRGAAPGFVRASGYESVGQKIENYLEFMRTDFLLIAQIESKQAVDDLEKIVAVDGIDMIFIGPADLSASLGKLGDFTSNEFKRAFARIESITLEAGKFLGTIPFAQWSAARLFADGHQLVVGGSDAVLLAKAAREDQESLSRAVSGFST